MRAKNSAGFAAQSLEALLALSSRCSSLIVSHISSESWSRIIRAFSRAA